jgi:hypothetical protein
VGLLLYDVLIINPIDYPVNIIPTKIFIFVDLQLHRIYIILVDVVWQMKRLIRRMNMKDKANQKNKENQDVSAEGEEKVKKSKHRSPNFPSINLQKALDKAKELDEAYKRAEVPMAVVHEKLGLKRFSGVAIQATAALKAYGLIDINGDGDKRTVKLTERAMKILGGHPDQDKLLKDAALNPDIYKRILARYQSEGLPTDEALSTYLQWDCNFNPKSIKGFIADFRNTIDFAKITITDIISSSGEKNGESAVSGVGDSKPPIDTSTQFRPHKGAELPQDRCDMATDTFTLEEGSVVLQYPKELSQASFEDFKAWTELLLRKISRSIKDDTSPVKDEPKE